MNSISRSLLFLAHILAVSDFRIDVTLACQKKGFELVAWLNEYELGRDYAEIDYKGRRKMRAVQPDGYFVIREGERQAHAFVEIDMSTTPCRRWAPKIEGLCQYRSSGKSTERFATKSLRVFRVTTSESRRTLLINSTEQEIPSKWQPLFGYAIRDEVNVESVLAKPIWEVVGEEGKRAIF